MFYLYIDSSYVNFEGGEKARISPANTFLLKVHRQSYRTTVRSGTANTIV